MRLILTFAMAWGLAAIGVLAGEATPAAAGAILDDGTVWRANFVLETYGDRFASGDYVSPLPPAEWTGAEFDDSSWARWQIGRSHGRYYAYGMTDDGAQRRSIRTVCLRGKFTVTDPAGANLVLDFSYRGGVVAYVNGKEVRRQHLPEKAAADAVAEEYPKEAFYDAKGRPLPAVGSVVGQTYKANVEKRIRKIEGLRIPAELLRKGTNVLAVQVHSAPFDPNVAKRSNNNNPLMWTPGGPISLKLSGGPGAMPNVSRPAGVQVWATGVMDRPPWTVYADPHEKLDAVRITAARNGWFCGQAVVSSNVPIKGIRAVVSDLKQADGKGVVSAAEIKVLYAYCRDGRYGSPLAQGVPKQSWMPDPLLEEAPVEVALGPAGGALQPIWIKVRVLADAVPGEYRGTLSVTAGGRKTDVPVVMKVLDWKLPDPKEYISLAGLLQSPETVALQYDVQQWSDRHFALMEKAYELMGQAGGDFVWLPFTNRTNLGNTETLVRWVRTGADGDAKLKPDFTAFDRYMDMVQRHMKPRCVCLYVSDHCLDYTARSRYRPDREAQRGPDWKFREMPGTDAWRISVLDPATGKVTEELAPPFRKTTFDRKTIKSAEEMILENAAFYKEVLTEVRARLEKRGLDNKVVMLGINEDVMAKPSTQKFFEDLLPGLRWVRMCHPVTVGGKVAYNSAVYIETMPPPVPWDAKRKAGWQYEDLLGLFPRTGGATGNYIHNASDPALFRMVTEACQLTALTGRYPLQGIGRAGVDFWPVGAKQPGGGTTRTSSVCARWPESCWDQLNLDRSIEMLFAPGPDGAVTTMRFENYREGIQETEARIFIERAIVDGKLDAAMVKKCQELLDERHNIVRAACLGSGFDWYAANGSAGLTEMLFACAAEVAAKTGK